MKKNNVLFIVLGYVAFYYLFKNLKKKVGLPGAMNLSSAANQMATNQAKNINFVPDMSTMADDYNNDLKKCK